MKKKLLEEISLPKDAGPHQNTNIEWWYFFSFLEGDKGGRYAVMCSFFRVGEIDFLKAHYLIHSLIDLNKKVHHPYSIIESDLRRAMRSFYLPLYLLLNPADVSMWKLQKKLLKGRVPSPHQEIGAAVLKNNPTRIAFEENTIEFSGEREDSFEVHLSDDFYSADLDFMPVKPIALIGGQGNPDGLYYYSFTKNKVYGEIRTAGRIETVSGAGWFDHQWGRDYGLAKGEGWNWFGIQLDDGRELLLNEMTPATKDSPGKMANLIDRDGRLRFTRDITFTKEKYWRSFGSNAKYPIGWTIRIPEFLMELFVSAEFPKQEMPVLGPLKAIWEGAVKVGGYEILADGKRKDLSGRGFMELVGYA